MKKLIVFLLLFFAPACFAQVWHPANQATVEWDAVTKRSDGSAIPAGDTVKYQVWSRLGTAGTPAKVGAEITATQLVISYSVEGRYFAGVQAIRYPVGETAGVASAVSWSSDPLVCAGGTAFGIVYYLPLAAPVGLRPVE